MTKGLALSAGDDEKIITGEKVTNNCDDSVSYEVVAAFQSMRRVYMRMSTYGYLPASNGTLNTKLSGSIEC